MKEQRILARRKSDGLYAYFESIWSPLDHVQSVIHAKDFGTLKEIMVRLGTDHYKKYEAVEVTVSYKVGKVKRFPKESEIWEDE